MAKGQRSNTRDDFDRVKDALHKLRTENKKLRKEIGYLKKELTRFNHLEFDQKIENETADDFESAVVNKECLKCPQCKSEDFKEVPAGIFKIQVCNTCKFRKRLNQRLT